MVFVISSLSSSAQCAALSINAFRTKKKKSAYCVFVPPLSAAHRSTNKRHEETKLSRTSLDCETIFCFLIYIFFKSIQYGHGLINYQHFYH